MENKETITGKEKIKLILNFILSFGKNDIEIIDSEKLELLLNKLNEKKRNEDGIQVVTPTRLAMFNSEFGLDGTNRVKTYKEVANLFKTSEVRVRQAEVQVIRELISYQMIEEKHIHHNR